MTLATKKMSAAANQQQKKASATGGRQGVVHIGNNSESLAVQRLVLDERTTVVDTGKTCTALSPRVMARKRTELIKGRVML